MTTGGTKFRVRKLTRLPDGSLFAGTGEMGLITRVRKWAEAGFQDKPKPRLGDEPEVEVLVIRTDGKIWLIGGDLEVLELDEPFIAIGTGYIGALCAMKCGKSAEEAIKIVAAYDSDTSEPIHTMQLEQCASS